jgi:GNAT superfamily N-acetyltransferase
MHESLGTIELKDGERVEAGAVGGPDPEWAGRIEELLAHKGGIWNWQNSTVLRRETGVEARFYLLHRGGAPFANMMTATYRGVGHFGHVWTEPEERRKGAASRLMDLQMEDFRQRGGRALFLGTGFDSPAYRIYAAHGFGSVEERSGYMAWYTGSWEAFEAEYFAAGASEIQEADWPHWPASAALFIGNFPGVVRCAPLGLFGRISTEGALLTLIQAEEGRRAGGESPRAKALVQTESGAQVGLAIWEWDPLWPETCLVDLYCHPRFWNRGSELLAALELPKAERYLAYTDPGCQEKGRELLAAGFRATARHQRRVAVDAARAGWADVVAWEKG